MEYSNHLKHNKIQKRRKYTQKKLHFFQKALKFFWSDKRSLNLGNILLTKMKERFMDKLFSVFDKPRNRFITSEIKSGIDLLDLILGKYFYCLNYDEIWHILNYDSEVRVGCKLQKDFIAIINQILVITKDADYLENPSKQAEVFEYKAQIDQLIYQLYDLTKEEIKIIERE